MALISAIPSTLRLTKSSLLLQCLVRLFLKKKKKNTVTTVFIIPTEIGNSVKIN